MAHNINIIDLAHMEENARSINQWQNSRQKAIDYYNGEVNVYTKFYLDKIISTEIPLANNNITKRIIDRTSLVYIEDVMRKLINESNPKEPHSLQDTYIQQTRNKDTALNFAERRLNLLNISLIKITKRDDILDYITIDDFEIDFDEDPLKPISIIYPSARFLTRGNVKEQIWIEYTIDTITRFTKSGGNISVEDNPFGILPFVFTFTEQPMAGFTHASPANDLIQSNEMINVSTSDMTSNIHYQSYSVYVGRNLGGPQNKNVISVAPNRLITLTGPDADITALSHQDSIPSIKEAVKHTYTSVAQNYHLPVGFVDGITAESGISLKIRNTELLDTRKSSVKNWRSIESRIYDVERVVLETIDGIELPKKMVVDFGEHSLILSPDEQREKDQWDLDHNLITEAQILHRSDPDNYGSPEAAQLVIDANRKVNTKGRVTPANTAAAVGLSFGELEAAVEEV